jgi:hypothetical protein
MVNGSELISVKVTAGASWPEEETVVVKKIRVARQASKSPGRQQRILRFIGIYPSAQIVSFTE